MAQITLTALTGSESLGTIYTEQVQLNNKFIEMNTVFGSSSAHLSFNWLGKKKIFLIQGAQDGSTFSGTGQDAKLKDFVDTIELWANQGTMAVKVLTTSIGSLHNVHCIDFTWNRSYKDPNRLIYSLLMMEVASV
jgi:hypothetical protein